MNELKKPSLNDNSELAKAAENVGSLSEAELNAPVDKPEKEGMELQSCDCRSECKYNTGHSHRYASYGYSG